MTKVPSVAEHARRSASFCVRDRLGTGCFCDLKRAKTCGNFQPPQISIYDLLEGYAHVIKRKVLFSNKTSRAVPE
jgi:hypothetical protein